MGKINTRRKIQGQDNFPRPLTAKVLVLDLKVTVKVLIQDPKGTCALKEFFQKMRKRPLTKLRWLKVLLDTDDNFHKKFMEMSKHIFFSNIS